MASQKEALKALYKLYRVKSNNHRYRKDMRMRISGAGVTIRELTQQEKADIQMYWSRYGIKPDYPSFQWYYSINGNIDPKYISEDIFANLIWPSLNESKRCNGISDKNLFELLFLGEKQATTVFHNANGVFTDRNYALISRKQAIELANHYEDIVIKPTIDSCAGQGVITVHGTDCEAALSEYQSDYIVQNLVRQHESFSRLNSSSVNVVRMTSLLLGDSVNILESIVRVGAPGSFTDHKNIAIGIDNDGHLKKYGFTVNGKKVDALPNGFVFEGHALACYKEMKELVKRLHPRIPQARLIGWDLTTDENGSVVIIEANLGFPGIVRGQECNGPIFGDLTDKVLDFVLSIDK